MKTLFAFLFLVGISHGQNIDVSRGQTTRIQFDPYTDDRRTIEFDRHGRILSDTTIPEGVGVIYLKSNGRTILQYNRSAGPLYYRPFYYTPIYPTYFDMPFFVP